MDNSANVNKLFHFHTEQYVPERESGQSPMTTLQRKTNLSKCQKGRKKAEEGFYSQFNQFVKVSSNSCFWFNYVDLLVCFNSSVLHWCCLLQFSWFVTLYVLSLIHAFNVKVVKWYFYFFCLFPFSDSITRLS